jgi:hypothetical protein
MPLLALQRESVSGMYVCLYEFLSLASIFSLPSWSSKMNSQGLNTSLHEVHTQFSTNPSEVIGHRERRLRIERAVTGPTPHT